MPAPRSTLVLGLAGGLHADGSLPPHVERRVQRCIEIAAATQALIIFSSSFTLNKAPVTTGDGRIVSEASRMAAYARTLGHDGPIRCEQQSHDTIGSFYFLFRNFVEDLTCDDIWLVTSAFHMPRAKVIYHHMGRLFGVPASSLHDAISDDNRHAAREARERASLETYRKEWLPVTDRREFARKLFADHSNYNSQFSSDMFEQSSTMLY